MGIDECVSIGRMKLLDEYVSKSVCKHVQGNDRQDQSCS
jgi:hypothetical protein